MEGGAQVAAALLRAGLVDRIAWFHAPAVMGGDGWPAVQAFGIDRLDAMPRFVRAARDTTWRRHADGVREGGMSVAAIDKSSLAVECC